MIVVFRHCEKLKPCSAGNEYPQCCIDDNKPPNSCSDCSPQGYQRALGMYSSLTDLLSKRAPGKKLTHIYAAASQEDIKGCTKSRRMWELVTPLSSYTKLPVNTSYCEQQHEQVARDILNLPKDSYVAVSWEHENIPGLVGWLLALAKNAKSTSPIHVDRWHGDVFDQFWIVDRRGATPRFFIEPESILPGDCWTARLTDGKCPEEKSDGILFLISDQNSRVPGHVFITLLVIVCLVFLLILL